MSQIFASKSASANIYWLVFAYVFASAVLLALAFAYVFASAELHVLVFAYESASADMRILTSDPSLGCTSWAWSHMQLCATNQECCQGIRSRGLGNTRPPHCQCGQSGQTWCQPNQKKSVIEGTEIFVKWCK